MELKDFRRPKLAAEYRPDRAQVHRWVKTGQLRHVNFVCAYIPGWFSHLKDKWSPRDSMVYFAVNFARQVGNPILNETTNPKALRTVAKLYTDTIEVLGEHAEELRRRADEIEDSEAEAAD